MSDETLQPEDVENFVAQTNNAQAIETTEKVRTRESEIQTNIDFWKNLALEGIEVNENEIRAAIEVLPEVEGFDWYIAIPEGVKTSEVWQKVITRYPNDPSLNELNGLKLPRETKETFAVAARYSKKPDAVREEGLVKSAKDWERSMSVYESPNWEIAEHTYMSPLERVVAELRWNAENGTHLDEGDEITFCPGSRTTDGRVLGMHFNTLYNNCTFNSYDPSTKKWNLRVRQVVTKDTKVESNTNFFEQRPYPTK